MTQLPSPEGLPAGAEALPPPYEDFFIYSHEGTVKLRFAAKGTNAAHEFLEVKLADEVTVVPGQSLAEAFMRQFPLPPRMLAAQTDWKFCGKVAWTCGSENELRRDLAAIARIFARKYGVEIQKGTAFFYVTSGTPTKRPILLTESHYCIYRGDFHPLLTQRDQFMSLLKELEPGLLTRNYPVGCDGFKWAGSPHRHSSRQILIPLVYDERVAVEYAVERLSADEEQTIQDEIKDATNRAHRTGSLSLPFDD
jgi:hypothetical protein